MRESLHVTERTGGPSPLQLLQESNSLTVASNKIRTSPRNPPHCYHYYHHHHQPTTNTTTTTTTTTSTLQLPPPPTHHYYHVTNHHYNHYTTASTNRLFNQSINQSDFVYTFSVTLSTSQNKSNCTTTSIIRNSHSVTSARTYTALSAPHTHIRILSTGAIEVVGGGWGYGVGW